MEISRNRKAKLAAGGARGRDRLNELPDCLLHVILSQLKARQVVRTCVLSRRWRHLWLTSPCLDVDTSEFLLPHAAPYPPPPQLPLPRMRSFDAALGSVAVNHAPLPLPSQHITQDEFYYEFEDFVDCLLVHRSAGGTAPLDTLRLRIPHPLWSLNTPSMLSRFSNTSKYTSWVRRGLRCSPAELDVSGFVKLPPLASSSTRRLTKLRLDRVILHRDFAEHLKSGLPVLEDLEISGTELSGLSWIESGTLRHLAVDSSSAIALNLGGSVVFGITAPRLVSLQLAIQFRQLGFFGIVVHQARRLVRASIRLVDKPELRQREGGIFCVQDDRALLKSLCNLLGSLSHVRALKLSGFHDMRIVQQQIPVIPHLPRWMQQPRNFMQPPDPGFGPHNFIQPPFMPPPGPGIGHPNYHHAYRYNPYNVYQPAAPPSPLWRPMLQAMLEEENVGLPVFHGLTSLVECDTGHDFQTLWSFLHKAPALEDLTLQNCQCQMYPNASEMEPPQTILEETVSSNLKSVDIIYGNRDNNDQYKVQINEDSSSMIKWKLPATTMIRATKLPRHQANFAPVWLLLRWPLV